MPPYVMPEFQNRYGNAKGSYKSWGEMLQQPSTFRPKDFFKTGANIADAANFSVGNKNNQAFVSGGNNKLHRHHSQQRILSLQLPALRNTASMLNDKLHLDLGASYVLQGDQNMLSAGRYFNPLVPLYLFPRGD